MGNQTSQSNSSYPYNDGNNYGNGSQKVVKIPLWKAVRAIIIIQKYVRQYQAKEIVAELREEKRLEDEAAAKYIQAVRENLVVSQRESLIKLKSNSKPTPSVGFIYSKSIDDVVIVNQPNSNNKNRALSFEGSKELLTSEYFVTVNPLLGFVIKTKFSQSDVVLMINVCHHPLVNETKCSTPHFNTISHNINLDSMIRNTSNNLSILNFQSTSLYSHPSYMIKRQFMTDQWNGNNLDESIIIIDVIIPTNEYKKMLQDEEDIQKLSPTPQSPTRMSASQLDAKNRSNINKSKQIIAQKVLLLLNSVDYSEHLSSLFERNINVYNPFDNKCIIPRLSSYTIDMTYALPTMKDGYFGRYQHWLLEHGSIMLTLINEYQLTCRSLFNAEWLENGYELHNKSDFIGKMMIQRRLRRELNPSYPPTTASPIHFIVYETPTPVKAWILVENTHLMKMSNYWKIEDGLPSQSYFLQMTHRFHQSTVKTELVVSTQDIKSRKFPDDNQSGRETGGMLFDETIQIQKMFTDESSAVSESTPNNRIQKKKKSSHHQKGGMKHQYASSSDQDKSHHKPKSSKKSKQKSNKKSVSQKKHHNHRRVNSSDESRHRHDDPNVEDDDENSSASESDSDEDDRKHRSSRHSRGKKHSKSRHKSSGHRKSRKAEDDSEDESDENDEEEDEEQEEYDEPKPRSKSSRYGHGKSRSSREKVKKVKKSKHKISKKGKDSEDDSLSDSVDSADSEEDSRKRSKKPDNKKKKMKKSLNEKDRVKSSSKGKGDPDAVDDRIQAYRDTLQKEQLSKFANTSSLFIAVHHGMVLLYDTDIRQTDVSRLNGTNTTTHGMQKYEDGIQNEWKPPPATSSIRKKGKSSKAKKTTTTTDAVTYPYTSNQLIARFLLCGQVLTFDINETDSIFHITFHPAYDNSINNGTVVDIPMRALTSQGKIQGGKDHFAASADCSNGQNQSSLQICKLFDRYNCLPSKTIRIVFDSLYELTTWRHVFESHFEFSLAMTRQSLTLSHNQLLYSWKNYIAKHPYPVHSIPAVLPPNVISTMTKYKSSQQSSNEIGTPPPIDSDTAGDGLTLDEKRQLTEEFVENKIHAIIHNSKEMDGSEEKSVKKFPNFNPQPIPEFELNNHQWTLSLPLVVRMPRIYQNQMTSMKAWLSNAPSTIVQSQTQPSETEGIDPLLVEKNKSYDAVMESLLLLQDYIVKYSVKYDEKASLPTMEALFYLHITDGELQFWSIHVAASDERLETVHEVQTLIAKFPLQNCILTLFHPTYHPYPSISSSSYPATLDEEHYESIFVVKNWFHHNVPLLELVLPYDKAVMQSKRSFKMLTQQVKKVIQTNIDIATHVGMSYYYPIYSQILQIPMELFTIPQHDEIGFGFGLGSRFGFGIGPDRPNAVLPIVKPDREAPIKVKSFKILTTLFCASSCGLIASKHLNSGVDMNQGDDHSMDSKRKTILQPNSSLSSHDDNQDIKISTTADNNLDHLWMCGMKECIFGNNDLFTSQLNNPTPDPMKLPVNEKLRSVHPIHPRPDLLAVDSHLHQGDALVDPFHPHLKLNYSEHTILCLADKLYILDDSLTLVVVLPLNKINCHVENIIRGQQLPWLRPPALTGQGSNHSYRPNQSMSTSRSTSPSNSGIWGIPNEPLVKSLDDAQSTSNVPSFEFKRLKHYNSNRSFETNMTNASSNIFGVPTHHGHKNSHHNHEEDTDSIPGLVHELDTSRSSSTIATNMSMKPSPPPIIPSYLRPTTNSIRKTVLLPTQPVSSPPSRTSTSNSISPRTNKLMQQSSSFLSINSGPKTTDKDTNLSISQSNSGMVEVGMIQNNISRQTSKISVTSTYKDELKANRNSVTSEVSSGIRASSLVQQLGRNSVAENVELNSNEILPPQEMEMMEYTAYPDIVRVSQLLESSIHEGSEVDDESIHSIDRLDEVQPDLNALQLDDPKDEEILLPGTLVYPENSIYETSSQPPDTSRQEFAAWGNENGVEGGKSFTSSITQLSQLHHPDENVVDEKSVNSIQTSPKLNPDENQMASYMSHQSPTRKISPQLSVHSMYSISPKGISPIRNKPKQTKTIQVLEKRIRPERIRYVPNGIWIIRFYLDKNTCYNIKLHNERDYQELLEIIHSQGKACPLHASSPFQFSNESYTNDMDQWISELNEDVIEYDEVLVDKIIEIHAEEKANQTMKSNKNKKEMKEKDHGKKFPEDKKALAAALHAKFLRETALGVKKGGGGKIYFPPVAPKIIIKSNSSMSIPFGDRSGNKLKRNSQLVESGSSDMEAMKLSSVDEENEITKRKSSSNTVTELKGNQSVEDIVTPSPSIPLSNIERIQRRDFSFVLMPNEKVILTNKIKFKLILDTNGNQQETPTLDRLLILTNKPRLMTFDPVIGVKKGDIVLPSAETHHLCQVYWITEKDFAIKMNGTEARMELVFDNEHPVKHTSQEWVNNILVAIRPV